MVSMAEPKTKPTDQDVNKFLDSVSDKQRREDSRQLLALMQKITGVKPVMWGTSIVGFGTQHYKSAATGREGDWMAIGFSPRKQALTVYGLIYYDKNRATAQKLGPHKAGKGCLYIKKLSDIDLAVLKQMIKKSFAENNNA
jgi:hypothetical protein